MSRDPVLNILLVEDEHAWQLAIAQLLETSRSPRCRLVAVASDFESALQAFHQYWPDVVLLDWQINGPQDGLAVGQALIQAGFPLARILLVSGATPSSIPAHPYRAVPKSKLASHLLETLLEIEALL